MEWWVAGRRRSVAASARDPEPLRHTCNPSLKVTFDLKTQLRELARCGGPIQDDPLVAALVAPPVVDVRLTAWLLRPSAWEVVDGEVDAKPRAGAAPRTLAGLAARYDGSVAAVDAGLPGLVLFCGMVGGWVWGWVGGWVGGRARAWDGGARACRACVEGMGVH